MIGGTIAMGFFGELKQDLSQAVNELMPEDELKTESTGQEGLSLGEMLENIDNIEIPDDEADKGADTEEPENEIQADAVEDDIKASDDDINTSDDNIKTSDDDGMNLESMLENFLAAEEAPAQEHTEVEDEPVVNENKGDRKTMDTFSTAREASDETSVITSGMTITGDVLSEGSLDIVGIVNGNIDILGKLNVTGHINGNSKAAEIYADGAKINGEVISEGAVKIGTSTVIIGNITATSAVIAGAVKGDIDVKGPVILDASAIVMGNIKSKSVQINNGAVIEGMCSQCYADVSPTAFFDDYKPEIKKTKSAK
jgi:cytoskeletal protein CcmA (bactofilin family)